MSDNLRFVCESVYFLRNTKIRDADTRRQYGYAIDNFETPLCRAAKLDDLSDDNVCAMMVHLREKGLAARTINERRGRINALWSWLAKRGMVKTWPTVPAMAEPKRLPVAWTVEQVQAILAACDVQGGRIEAVPAWLWWRTIHLVLWDTAARITEVMSLRWGMFDAASMALAVPAEIRKGQHEDALYRLHEETVAHLCMMRSYQKPTDEMMFPWPFKGDYIWNRYKQLLKEAGLPFDRRSMFHRMRRSVATHFEIAGGDATALLGHSSRAVTRCYLDPKLLHSPAAIDRLPRLRG